MGPQPLADQFMDADPQGQPDTPQLVPTLVVNEPGLPSQFLPDGLGRGFSTLGILHFVERRRAVG